MPLYEYTCRACRQRFELFRSISERDLPAACPHCGEQREHLRVPAAVVGRLAGGRSGSGLRAGCGSSGGSGFR